MAAWYISRHLAESNTYLLAHNRVLQKPDMVAKFSPQGITGQNQGVSCGGRTEDPMSLLVSAGGHSPLLQATSIFCHTPLSPSNRSIKSFLWFEALTFLLRAARENPAFKGPVWLAHPPGQSCYHGICWFGTFFTCMQNPFTAIPRGVFDQSAGRRCVCTSGQEFWSPS